MKNTTVLYIVALCISICLPFIVVDDFVHADQELFMYYYITIAIYLLAIISACLKEGNTKEALLPLFSFFTMLSSGFHSLLALLVLFLGVARYLDHDNFFFIILALLQLALCFLAIKHIRPQKSENLEHKLDDPHEF
ncbi:MAG: hypothetical protein GQ574_18970 [Crocinitomix sp.]|nr:hypothetical protein [Crocinitomix sp.]